MPVHYKCPGSARGPRPRAKLTGRDEEHLRRGTSTETVEAEIACRRSLREFNLSEQRTYTSIGRLILGEQETDFAYDDKSVFEYTGALAINIYSPAVGVG